MNPIKETLTNCPICGSSKNEILYQNIEDITYYAIDGGWNYFNCNECLSVFQNPRLTKDCIHIAYKTYYTHDSKPKKTRAGIFGRIKELLINSYINKRCETKLYPSCRYLNFLPNLIPFIKREIDYQYRNLEKPTSGNSLLDIGCGNGEFLLKAKSCGWNATGVDFDRNAVETCSARGLDCMVGDFDTIKESDARYDYISMSHVIEHVHDPLDAIRICYKLLKNDGVLWIETPNINSYGHRIFKENWRGIECPRHLVIMNPSTLMKILKQVGFSSVCRVRRNSPTKFFFDSSFDSINNKKIKNSRIIRFAVKLAAYFFAKIEFYMPGTSEVITLIAKK